MARKNQPIAQPIPVFHTKPKIHWLILKGRRKLMPIPYAWSIPDLKLFKKHLIHLN